MTGVINYRASPDYYNNLAFQYGVGVSTPTWSSRRIYYQSSVSNGEKMQRRINAVGGGVNNITELRQKELEATPAWKAEQKRLAAVKEAERVAEVARLDLIVRNDRIALELFTKLDNQRIAEENAEKKRLAAVKEAQRVAAVKAENLRVKLQKEKLELERVTEVNRLQVIEDKETQRVTKSIPLLTTILPIGVIGLFLYSRTARK